jgi:hypothetical protein
MPTCSTANPQIESECKMPTDPREDLTRKAICDRAIRWKDSCLRRFRNDPDMKSFTERGVIQAVVDHIKNDGPVKSRKETDPDWLREHPDDPWWYFAVVPTAVFRKGLFIKFKLLWEDGDDEDDAAIEIVSIHEQT